MYEIVEIIKNFNREKLGIINLTWQSGDLLEFNKGHYINKAKLRKLIKQGKIKQL